jgi:Tfp pilus assembly protein PilO
VVGELVNKAVERSDSVFLILLIIMGIGMWWIIQYVFKKNDQREQRMQEENNIREKRYIKVIETQAKAFDGLQKDVHEIKTIITRREA